MILCTSPFHDIPVDDIIPVYQTLVENEISYTSQIDDTSVPIDDVPISRLDHARTRLDDTYLPPIQLDEGAELPSGVDYPTSLDAQPYVISTHREGGDPLSLQEGEGDTLYDSAGRVDARTSGENPVSNFDGNSETRENPYRVNDEL